MTTSEIEAVIATLESQMSKTAGRERFGDREVTWSTASELVERLNYFRGLLAESTATPRTRFIRMYTSNGY